MGEHDEICEGRVGFDSVEVARVALRERYLHRLLPVLSYIDMQGSGLSTWERFRAVRFAADMSLALTAAGAVNWSQALARNLNRQLSSSEEEDSEARGVEHESTVAEQIARAAWVQIETSRRARQFVLKQRQAACANLNTSLRRRRRSSGHKRRQVLSFGKASAWKRAYIKALRLRSARRSHQPAIAKQSADQMSEFEPLQNIIPGGHQLMDPVTLLQEAANYIVSLQVQVDALNTLAEAAVPRSS